MWLLKPLEGCAKNEGCALIKHGDGEVAICYRVLQWMLDEHPLPSVPAVDLLTPCPLRDTVTFRYLGLNYTRF
jgi:hypothetical protein